MSRRLRIAVALLEVGLVAGLLWQAIRQREPLYQGKPLAFWLRGFELDDQPGKLSFSDAVEAVRQTGTNALPILLSMLRARDSDLKQRLIRLGRNQPFIAIHYVTADSRRWVARQGFIALGSLAKYAIPQLVEINRDDVSRGERTRYAAEILELLKQQGEDVNEEITKAVKKGGPEAAAKSGSK